MVSTGFQFMSLILYISRESRVMATRNCSFCIPLDVLYRIIENDIKIKVILTNCLICKVKSGFIYNLVFSFSITSCIKFAITFFL